MSNSQFDQIINRKGTYSTQWDFIADRFGQGDLLPFTISDTDFAAPDVVLESLKERLAHPVFGYTRWNHEDYKRAIVYWFQDRFDQAVDPDWIVYSPSVIYSVARLIELNSHQGEGVIIQTPAYDAFFKTITASNRQLVENPLIYHGGSYSLDFDDLECKLSDPNNTVLLLCQPHNPTGRVWTAEELQKIISLCKQYDVFLISDDIHMDVLRRGINYCPIISYQGDYPRMAVCSSISKTFNVPGLGGSYLLIVEPELRTRFEHLLKDRDGLSSASIFGITATMSAYTPEGGQWVDELNDYVEQNFEILEEFLHEHFPEIIFETPQSTYLAWIDLSPLAYSMEEIQEALIEVGKVAIMAGNIYGKQGETFLRLNLGCSRDKLLDGLNRLKISLNSLLDTHS